MHSRLIEHQSILHAILITDIDTAIQSVFPTPESLDFQVGVIHKQGHDIVQPHKHVCESFTLSSVQECIYVVKGCVRTTLITNSGKPFKTFLLQKSSALLTITGGHAFEFLKKSILFEVKQGPYARNQKVYFPAPFNSL